MTIQQNLLQLLADGHIHSGEELAQNLGVSRAAIWKQMRRLEELELSIDARAGQGYQLAQPLELLDSDTISRLLDSKSAAALDVMHVLWNTESTNRFLADINPPPIGSWQLCVAEYQSAGRGRRGRQWVAPVGHGICLSLGYSFASSPPSLACLSLVAGIGLLRALKANGVATAQLKWPNDVLIGDRKLAGILIDISGETGGPLHAIIGIGLNYRMTDGARDAIRKLGGLAPIALHEALSDTFPGRNALVAQIAQQVYSAVTRYSELGFSPFIAEWNSADYLSGKQVIVQNDVGETFGTAAGIASDGQLKIVQEHETRLVASGDVSVRKID